MVTELSPRIRGLAWVSTLNRKIRAKPSGRHRCFSFTYSQERLSWLLLVAMVYGVGDAIKVQAATVNDTPTSDVVMSPPVDVDTVSVEGSGSSADAGQNDSPTPSVIGGTNADKGEFPFFVKLNFSTAGEDKGYCGASLIASEWILTAAHCVERLPEGSRIYASFGDYFTDQAHGHLGSREVKEVIIHPLRPACYPYTIVEDTQPPRPPVEGCGPPPANVAQPGYDLALLKVDSIDGVTPVVLGAPGKPDLWGAGATAKAIGFGWTNTDPISNPSSLQKADVPIKSDDAMAGYYANWRSELLIGAGDAQHESCKGDSGGPLLVDDTGRWVAVGVFSFLNVDKDKKTLCSQPGGYAELTGTGQLAWIASIVPSITDTWGQCLIPNANGRTGRWSTRLLADGSGEVFCLDDTPPQATPTPLPPSSGGEPGSICTNRPSAPGCKGRLPE